MNGAFDTSLKFDPVEHHLPTILIPQKGVDHDFIVENTCNLLSQKCWINSHITNYLASDIICIADFSHLPTSYIYLVDLNSRPLLKCWKSMKSHVYVGFLILDVMEYIRIYL